MPPAATLRRAIVDYAFVNGEGLKPKIIRPRTAAVLTIRISGNACVDNRLLPSASVGGVHELPFTLVPSEGDVDFVRVQFTPGGLRYFSSVAAITLRQRSVSAAFTFPPEMVSALVNEIRSSPEVERRVSALDRFFTSLYSPLSPRDMMILELAGRLAHGTETEFARILDNAPVGLRQIERLFAQLIGFSPRKFAQVSRFERAEQEVLSNARVSLSDVALRSGYYDQAHFNRDFKRFVSMPPGSYSFCAPG